MKKKKPSLSGNLPPAPDQKIYLNVNALEEGEYELTIIYKNKALKTIKFRK